ncbi:hypothetical protein ALC57_02391 [Trachymyrmex cornetzi]|uniref:THAP domain-containing protein 9 n=1 Tax=Trachymyrmex cornetzi TaxID=471704 RepID=A0A151JNV6_9HYME|nr:hypothetical protein ALC57_02391 [Trachymyrmex cornetzi]
MFCISVYKRSRSTYNFLSKYLLCPSPSTLNIWDEVAIQPALYYDKRTDKIVGFEDWGHRRTRKFADHAIVFYLRYEFETTKGSIKLPECTLATADIIYFLDDLFDSFNGRKGQGLSSIISQQSNHMLFWRKAIRTLRRMEFIEKKTREPIRKNAPKCIKNWIWTIQGAQILWRKLKNSNFSNFNLRYINQDPLENFFGQIRDIGHRNNNPSPYQFFTAFKSLLIINLTSKHSPSGNCKEIHNSKSMSLINMFCVSEITSDNTNNSREVECTGSIIHNENTKNIFVVQNIVNRVQSKVMCAKCAEELTSNDIFKKLRDSVTAVEERMPDLCYEIKVKKKLINIFNKNLAITMHCASTLSTILDITV